MRRPMAVFGFRPTATLGREGTGPGTVGSRAEAHLSRVRVSERDDVAVLKTDDDGRFIGAHGADADGDVEFGFHACPLT